MNKVYNKKIILGLGILAFLGLALIVMPAKADAQYNGNSPVSPYSTYSSPRYVEVPIPVYVPTPTPVYTQTAAPAPTYTQNATASQPADDKNDTSNLAANAIYGSNSFLPSGIIQWIFFAILVLLVVILARRIFGADKKYHATPMKHA